MSNGMKYFIAIAIILVLFKHPELATKLINDLSNLING